MEWKLLMLGLRHQFNAKKWVWLQPKSEDAAHPQIGIQRGRILFMPHLKMVKVLPTWSRLRTAACWRLTEASWKLRTQKKIGHFPAHNKRLCFEGCPPIRSTISEIRNFESRDFVGMAWRNLLPFLSVGTAMTRCPPLSFWLWVRIWQIRWRTIERVSHFV